MMLRRWSIILACAPGCSDDCGPQGAPAAGLTVSSALVSLTYGALAASTGNDCPPVPMRSVISLTIDGIQQGTTDQHITICIAKPDELADHPLSFGDEVKLFGVSGADASCTYGLDFATPPSGTVEAKHMCGNGTDKAGFALTVNATASITRHCGAMIDTQPVTLAGTTAVAKREN